MSIRVYFECAFSYKPSPRENYQRVAKRNLWHQRMALSWYASPCSPKYTSESKGWWPNRSTMHFAFSPYMCAAIFYYASHRGCDFQAFALRKYPRQDKWAMGSARCGGGSSYSTFSDYTLCVRMRRPEERCTAGSSPRPRSDTQATALLPHSASPPSWCSAVAIFFFFYSSSLQLTCTGIQF